MLLAIEPIAIVVSEIDPFFFKGSTRNKPSFYDFFKVADRSKVNEVLDPATFQEGKIVIGHRGKLSALSFVTHGSPPIAQSLTPA